MKYLGPVKKEEGKLLVPESFKHVKNGQTYEAVEIDGDVILVAGALDREAMERTERLAQAVINDHRKTLEGLAR